MKSIIGNNKVLILGLPKSGTSTMATMLRILGYQVTGPNPNIMNMEALQSTYNSFEAFQDYPWCFEYPALLKNKEVKVIVLKRDKESWVKSFKNSYGGVNENYLSYKYMQLSKSKGDSIFYEYHTNYYEEVLSFLKLNKFEYLEISLANVSWKILCEFLGKSIPRNILGVESRVPQVNKSNYKNKGRFFKFKKQLKKHLHTILGKKYFKLTSFIYKNK